LCTGSGVLDTPVPVPALGGVDVSVSVLAVLVGVDVVEAFVLLLGVLGVLGVQGVVTRVRGVPSLESVTCAGMWASASHGG